MKKYFIKLYQEYKIYGPINDLYTKNFDLQFLWFFLYRSQYDWINISITAEKVVLWNSENLKNMVDIDFKTKQEMEDFYKSYREYSKKRWDDMPKLEMTLKNYEEIIQKWNHIVDTMPEYIIFSQDDQGYVDLVAKQELSQQDLADMKIEHEKYLKYSAAKEKYERAYPNRSEVWRSPEDSEFEADWQKYLED